MPKFLSVEQGTPEWLKAREGRITASRLKDVLDFNKNGKESAKRSGYRMELIAERLTGRAEEHYVSPAMEWGISNEQWAVSAYEFAFDVITEKCGFAVHPAMDFSGASPDRLVGKNGLLECKCPNTTTHLGWMMVGEVPEEHKPQMYWEMACCERDWCDFVSFDPRLPDGLQVFTKRLEYDHAIVKDMADKVQAFHEEIEAAISRMRGGK